MSIAQRLTRIIRRGMVDCGLTRQAAFEVGGRRLVYEPIRRQSRLLDQLIDQGFWSYEPELAHFIFANPFGYERFVDGGAHIVGSADAMLETLGVEPGAVTPFAAINDTGRRVTIVLDAQLMRPRHINAHPLVNTMTTSLETRGSGGVPGSDRPSAPDRARPGRIRRGRGLRSPRAVAPIELAAAACHLIRE